MNTLGIVVACGKEEEVAPGTEAAFLTLGNMPMFVHSLQVFEKSPVVDGVIIAVAKERIDATVHAIRRFGCTKIKGIVVGSTTRLTTLRTVFSKMPEPASLIVIHEASRPFLKPEYLEETVKAAKRYGCSIAAHRLPGSAKYAKKGMKATETLERNAVWIAQTPQVFKSDVIGKIIDAKSKNVKIIDDESEYVRKPAEVHMVEVGDGNNMKVRSSRDLAIATALLNAKLV